MIYILNITIFRESLFRMRQLDRIKQMRSKIQEVARKHNASRIFLFGSCARGEETSESDIDFLADFNENASLFDQVGLQLELSDSLECKVDVIPLTSLDDPIFGPKAKKDMLLL